MSDARIGYGTILSRRTAIGSPDTYQAIAERVTLGGPNMQRDAPDVTHMESPGGWREFVAGLKDGGEVTLEGNFIPKNATQSASTGVLSEFTSSDITEDTAAHWQLTFPDGSPETVWEFDGIVTAFEPSMPVDDKMSFSLTIKVTGQPTLA